MNPSEAKISLQLQRLCARALTVVWHENRTTVLTVSLKGKFLQLRLHRLFANAPTPVIEALSSYIVKGDRKSGVVIRQMIHWYFSQGEGAPDILPSMGKAYDLGEISKRIQEQYFSSDLKITIGWSDRGGCGKFRHMTFGSYDRHRNQIRIHPLLDEPQVPLYFVEFIVYHEMLHAVCPSKVDARGAVRCHTAEFREKERLFRDFAKAKSWEKTSLQFFKNRSNCKTIPK